MIHGEKDVLTGQGYIPLKEFGLSDYYGRVKMELQL